MCQTWNFESKLIFTRRLLEGEGLSNHGDGYHKTLFVKLFYLFTSFSNIQFTFDF